MMQPGEQYFRYPLLKGCFYYLHVATTPVSPPFIRVWKNDPRATPFFIPAAPESVYLILSNNRAVELFFSNQEIAEKAFRPSRITDMAKVARLLRFHKFTRFEQKGLSILPLLYLSGDSGEDVGRILRTMAGHDWGLNTPWLQRTLSYEFMRHRSPSALPSVHWPSVGMVVHLHYTDVWPDFEARLGRLSIPFKLFVTLNEPDADLVRRIKGQFGDAAILVYPNRGRDVGPFIQLMRDGHLDGVDLVCKMHGKKTLSLGSRAAVGDLWRRSVINDLIGSDELVKNIVGRFAKNPSLGLVGPALFRVPNEFIGMDAWGANNEAKTKKLAEQLGCPADQYKPDFFAGTMFWIRRELLNLLKPLNLSQADFPDEKGQADGTLQHALERLFGALPGLAQPTMTTEESTWEAD